MRHSFKAQRMKIHTDERRSVHEKPDHDEQQTAYENVQQELPARIAFFAALRKRKNQRNAHKKQKRGENKIRRRPAVPFGMRDGPINFFVAAGIVHQDHPSHREAAEDVQANQAP